jgi:hypothetical protein
MDSGWIAFSVLLVVVIGFYIKNVYYGTSPISSYAGLNVLKYISPFINVVPVAILFSGIFSDIFHQEVKLGIPSYGVLVALGFARILSSWMQSTGLTPKFTDSPLASDSSTFWCTLPGLEMLENPFFPSSIFASVTILAYYLYWTDIGSQQYQFIGALLAFVLSGTFIGFTLGQCHPYYLNMFPFLRSFGVLIPTAALSFLVAGVIFGAVSGDQSKNPTSGMNVGGSGGSSSGGGSSGGFGGFGTGCPPGQEKTEKQFCIPCDTSTSIVIGEQCVPKDKSGVASNQTPADSGLGQLVEVKAYKNGVEVTDSLSK